MRHFRHGLAVALCVAWAPAARAQQQEPPPTEQGSSATPPPPPVATEPAPAPPQAPPEPEPAQTADSLAQSEGPGFWEGGGVRVTDGTILHPAATIGTSYQTNVFYQAAEDGNGPVSSAVLRAGIAAT